MKVSPAFAARLRLGSMAGLFLLLPLGGFAQEYHALAYASAPIDNPLKGFGPYDGDRNRDGFPHSLEWFYQPLAPIMTAPGTFNWQPLEKHLAQIAARGRQAVFRITLDYPGTAPGTPRYLLDAGLKTHAYDEQRNQGRSVSPDYEDPRLRAALGEFIAAFGSRYDGDPRIAFLTVGLLGFWGEWHDEAHHDWFASKAVQREVMDGYQRAFTKTRLLVRYPAGPADPYYAENGSLPLGYHDDSIAWDTIPNGQKKSTSFFMGKMADAHALDKWRTQPIGGEVRPEVWDTLWNDPTGAPKGEEYDRCVDATHATWLMNSGAFHPGLQGENRVRALAGARRLGYELFVSGAALGLADGVLRVRIQVHDTGVAPFYYAWPMELGLLDAKGRVAIAWRTDWSLPSVEPGEPAREFSAALARPAVPAGTYRVLVRVVNPLPSGPALRFADQAQDADLPGWLTLGNIDL